MRERDYVKEAAQAHSNLSMYYAVIALCESGSFYGHHDGVDRIIAICKQESTEQLRLYDAARAKLPHPTRTPKREA